MLRLLTILIPANGFQNLALDADYIRIKTASVGFTFQTDNNDDFLLIEGEEAKLKGFQVLKIINTDAADQTLSLYVGKDAQIGSSKLSGNVSISSAVALDGATLTALETVELGSTTLAALETVELGSTTLAALEAVEHSGLSYGASFRSTTNLTANNPQTVFSAASNVNGAIVHCAKFVSDFVSGGRDTALLAKTSPPGNSSDGDAILTADNVSVGSVVGVGSTLDRPVKIPAGKGLYFIAGTNENAGNRSVLYTLL